MVGRGPVANNLGAEKTEALRAQLGLKDGDAVFFVAGEPRTFFKFAGAARTKVGEELDLIVKDRFELCWIVDFPMYEWNEEEKKIDFSHNPFSMPNMAGRRISRARCRTIAKKFSRSRRSNTTSSATASNCPPARSAIIVPT